MSDRGMWEYNRDQAVAHERDMERQSLKLADTFVQKGIAGKCDVSVDHGKVVVKIEYFYPKTETKGNQSA